MQSVCLDEFGGEKAVHPGYQETTLIQHIFGGRLRSQVACINEAWAFNFCFTSVFLIQCVIIVFASWIEVVQPIPSIRMIRIAWAIYLAKYHDSSFSFHLESREWSDLDPITKFLIHQIPSVMIKHVTRQFSKYCNLLEKSFLCIYKSIKRIGQLTLLCLKCYSDI